jgi:hypothetical protein
MLGKIRQNREHVVADQKNPESLATRLQSEYGLLLDTRAISRLLGFKSAETCMRALRSGSLRLPAFRLPGRPGYYVLADEFARWLDQYSQAHPHAMSDGMPAVNSLRNQHELARLAQAASPRSEPEEEGSPID